VNCDGVVRRVSNYIDGDLEVSVVEEIELHLKTCRECTILVQQTKLTVTLYRDSDLVDFPKEYNCVCMRPYGEKSGDRSEAT